MDNVNNGLVLENIGKHVEEYTDFEEMFKASGLDYDVSIDKAWVKDGNVFKAIPNSYCTFNETTHEAMATVGKGYTVVQNRDLFSSLQPFMHKLQPTWSGSLNNGATAFMQCKVVNDPISIGTNDDIDRYVFLSNSHDGSSSVKILFTPIRQQCDNMLSRLFKEQNQISFKHSRRANEKMLDIPAILELEMQYAKGLKQYMESLKSVSVTGRQVSRVVMELILTPEEIKHVKDAGGLSKVPTEQVSQKKSNAILDIVHYVHTGKGQQVHQDTALHLYNGISSYYQNRKSYTSYDYKLKCVTEGYVTDKMQRVSFLINEICF
jgi:phage/plasmid-like protein (TIGR03299 family)